MRYIRAFALIYLSLWLGNSVASLLPIAIPGSIIGMLILFALLSWQLVPVAWIKPGCQLFIRYMVLLFVPIGVGIMQYYPQIIADLLPLLLSCLLSTLLVFVVVGYSSSYLQRSRTDNNKPDNMEQQR
ncbi:CidA/LrgA family protein [Serratia microhaemolytica]|uniref:CidA/LrgA family protein n=1 Tax=Serratia microhaemolytica TaxID=2675110 RepID=UPI001F0BE278|nr:CidA/LrgA family protein [Serratia microhaemolytica]